MDTQKNSNKDNKVLYKVCMVYKLEVVKVAEDLQCMVMFLTDTDQVAHQWGIDLLCIWVVVIDLVVCSDLLIIMLGIITDLYHLQFIDHTDLI